MEGRMSLQDHDPAAQALPGDELYNVSVRIDDLGASSPEDAAALFWRLLTKDFHEYGLTPVIIDTYGPSGHVQVSIDTATGEPC
jgi:hypothetical protein